MLRTGCPSGDGRNAERLRSTSSPRPSWPSPLAPVTWRRSPWRNGGRAGRRVGALDPAARTTLQSALTLPAFRQIKPINW